MSEKLPCEEVSTVQHIYRWFLRAILILYHFLMFVIKRLPKRKSKPIRKLNILATGTFYSDNWLMTHLRPMASAENCQNVTMVASSQVPEMVNVSAVYPPRWLQGIMGQVGSRLLYFCWLAIKERPDVLVGFHLLLNGLFVALLAKLIGAKSVYICGGGPREVAGGGFSTENRIFKKMSQADYFIERLLLKSVNEMDLVISMGSSAIDFFKNNGVKAKFEIVPGGFDNELFSPSLEKKKEYDLIFIGRLSNIKRVDRLLNAIKLAKQNLPNLNAVIVGDGPDKEDLQALASELGIASDVNFVGWQNNVDVWLQKSKCFVLTSDSEGLSQALIQAMLTGLPAITSDVGDIGDLLESGKNGYLISDLKAHRFSEKFVDLLADDMKLHRLSNNALNSAQQFSIPQVEKKWSEIFESYI